eukprot:TRINITY_DN12308_c0_g1_i1.p2 TRINITY_DN12308_c0_g1~~TRINITY_DN12308_c0_g1_i1.p2  ORF type:complete len:233 (+),score=32.88 TRINITY_DN12308_c0_g1_i1:217-915(+)
MTVVRGFEAGDSVRRRVADTASSECRCVHESGHVGRGSSPSASHQTKQEPGSAHVLVPRRVAWFLAAVLVALAFVSYNNAKHISMLQRRVEEIEKAGSPNMNPSAAAGPEKTEIRRTEPATGSGRIKCQKENPNSATLTGTTGIQKEHLSSATGHYRIFNDTDLPGYDMHSAAVRSIEEAEAIADAREAVSFTYVVPWGKVFLKSIVPTATPSPRGGLVFCISGVRQQNSCL